MALMWGYASLTAKLVSSEVGVPVRWFLMLLTALTPPLFLLLTLTVPKPSPGAIPAALAVLFVVGWPLRRLMIRWLGGAPHIG